MDANIATVLVSIVAGVFSTISMYLQNRVQKVMTNVEDQTIVIEKENIIKNKLLVADQERNDIIQQIMLLTLDTNIQMLQILPTNEEMDKEMVNVYDELTIKYNTVTGTISSLSKEYEMLIDMRSAIQKDILDKK